MGKLIVLLILLWLFVSQGPKLIAWVHNRGVDADKEFQKKLKKPKKRNK